MRSYNNKNLLKARQLRSEMTPQEKHLWYDCLRNYPIKFYKQRPIDNYIVDFYCAKANLVVEVDGSQHYTEDGKEYDEIRTKVLEEYNLYVMRFSNADIDKNFIAVCVAIDEYIKKHTSPATEVATSP